MLYLYTSLNWLGKISTALICNTEEGKFWTGSTRDNTGLPFLSKISTCPWLGGGEIWTAERQLWFDFCFSRIEYHSYASLRHGKFEWLRLTVLYNTSLNWPSRRSTTLICNDEEGKFWTALKKTILVCFILVKWVPFSLRNLGASENDNEFHRSNTSTYLSACGKVWKSRECFGIVGLECERERLKYHSLCGIVRLVLYAYVRGWT